MTLFSEIDDSWLDFYSIQLDVDAIEAIDPNKDYGRLTLPVLECDKKGMHRSPSPKAKPKRDSRTRRLARAKELRMQSDELDKLLLSRP